LGQQGSGGRTGYTCPNHDPIKIRHGVLSTILNFRTSCKSFLPDLSTLRTPKFISAAAWAEIVFSFLAAYAALSDRDQQLRTVEALKPLYFARTVSFIWETLELDHVDSERKLLQQAQTFWEQRSTLLDSQSAVA
jgi:hypothetical protein